ncbi:hypothetical protein [Rhodobacter sp. NSM]|uniref:hypothetical protein n=1 Tax=Rhodobacter sp. NSM TaxID=3457501 RepID=UPI003FD4793B
MNKFQLVMSSLIGIVIAVVARFVHRSMVFDNTAILHPFFNEDFWIALAVCLSGTLLVTVILANRADIVRTRAAGHGTNPPEGGRSNDGTSLHALGVLTSILLGPALQFAWLRGIIPQDGSTSDFNGASVILVSVFGWLPGGLIGGLIANSARKGSLSWITSLAAFSSMFVWAVGSIGAF